MILNTRQTYGLVAQILHWVTALLILILLPLGLIMTGLPQETAQEVSEKSWLFSLHKTLGILVFFIAVLRILWALVQPHPRPLNADRKFESLAAQSVHWILYISIVCMPLSGWLNHSASEGFAPIWVPFVGDLPLVPKNPELAALFGQAHVFVAILLGLAIALHIAGALKHAVIDRDATLQRMLPGRYRAPQSDLPAPHFKRLPAVVAILCYCGLVIALGVDLAITRSQLAQDRALFGQRDSVDAGWRIDKANSSLDIQIIQMGNPVKGSFKNWDAMTVFDPDDLSTASVEVEVDVSSISLGGVSEQAKGKSFLNAMEFPIARFTSRSFRHLGGQSYEAEGHLALAGREQPLTLPFTLRIEAGRAHVESELTIERLAFGIGEKGFSKDDQLGFGVLVTVTLEAERAPSSEATLQ